MYKIFKKLKLTEKVYLMEIAAPRIANSAKPGQFIILMLDEKSERVPLTICDYDEKAETITIVFQVAGKSTQMLSEKMKNEFISNVAGPLGQPSELINMDMAKIQGHSILYIAGGVGAAPIYSQIKWLRNRNIEADIILGAKTANEIVLGDELRELSRNMYICTEDGSCGFEGFVTDKLKELLELKAYTYIVNVGPLGMMKAVCDITKKYEIKTIASLNPIMLDGTGMCGACRVTVNNEVKFACVDGPEFDGHQVDFQELITRQYMFQKEENEKIGSKHCSCGGIKC